MVFDEKLYPKDYERISWSKILWECVSAQEEEQDIHKTATLLIADPMDLRGYAVGPTTIISSGGQELTWAYITDTKNC